VNTGIPQSSPLSPILYLFYNADLLDIGTDPELNMTVRGWIDDVYFLTYGSTTEANCRSLAVAHRGAEEWSRRHGSKFPLGQYELVHFAKTPTGLNVKQPLALAETTVRPKPAARFLGVILDSSLNWQTYIKLVPTKVTRSIAALACLAGSTWSSGLLQLRRVYQAVVLPGVMYSSSACFTLKGERRQRNSAACALESI
jgi:hypothetical protein